MMPGQGQDKKAAWSMALELDISTWPGAMDIYPRWMERGASSRDEELFFWGPQWDVRRLWERCEMFCFTFSAKIAKSSKEIVSPLPQGHGMSSALWLSSETQPNIITLKVCDFGENWRTCPWLGHHLSHGGASKKEEKKIWWLGAETLIFCEKELDINIFFITMNVALLLSSMN